MTIQIVDYEHDHLDQLSGLINDHLSAVLPGWALPSAVIEEGMRRNSGEYVIDPWVVERKTVCAVEKQRVVAAAHLLRYGTGSEVGGDYQGAGDISWFAVWPEHDEAAKALLDSCLQQMASWNVPHVYAWNNGLPIPLVADIYDVWPHLIRLFMAAGFQGSRNEALFGGRLDKILLPDAPPLDGLICQRTLRSDNGVGFAGILNGQVIGWCDVAGDLTHSGALPTLRGWAELGEMYVAEEWRSQGIGTWLVRHAVEWLRLAGCDRIALCVDADDEARGAGRFYQSFGWDVFTRVQRGWRLQR